ncbi:MAG: inorganic diphosphatase [Clostridia bacterium]|jgi:manganese-dependent inorganic pyrophosphatase|nr:inorganic diphosphatase [Clostridia bacterium]
MDESRNIYIIGHKNPDTDSICSSIAYAYLKNVIDKENQYIPIRIGTVSSETDYVLKHFGIEQPTLIADVKTQINDISIKNIATVQPSISMKRAWENMKDGNITTLPVSEDGFKLDGIITVGDIAQSYMDIYDNNILSNAKTPYKNLIEVLEGKMIVGNIEDSICNGRILIGAMNPEVMESYINPKDIVILGNRYETQLCSIEMGAQCLIITGGLPVATSIKKLAEANNCAIILSEHDTYMVARLINQSIPISYFMKKANLTVFNFDDYIDEIREIMVKKRYRNFPVVDNENNFRGMISRASLINLRRKQVILVDHNERSQAVEGLEEAEILEIIDHHRIGDIETGGPVYFRNQPLGCTATILYNIYKENMIEIPKNIAGLLCAAILSDTLMFKSPTCTPMDRAAAEELAQTAQIEMIEFAKDMFRAGSNLSNKREKEIFYQDFKQFKVGNLSMGVGQINSMDRRELDEIKKRMLQYMNKVNKEKKLDLVLFMLTDIAHESTQLLFVGSHKELVSRAFDGVSDESSIELPGVVSRKKQVIPPLIKSYDKL